MRGRREGAIDAGGGELSSDPPKGLDETGRRVWTWAIETCQAASRPLMDLHREALVGLCDACSDAASAGEIIKREGVLIDGGREGMKRHPATSIRSQSLTIKRAFLAELGLTPTSSGRLPPAKKSAEKNPFAKFQE